MKSKTEKVSLQQIINRIPLLIYHCLVSFRSDYVPTLENDAFAIMNLQPSNMQIEQCVMIANFCGDLYFEYSPGRKMYLCFKQHYKQIMPAEVQSQPSVFEFYKTYAAFQPFKFYRDEKLEFKFNVLFL